MDSQAHSQPANEQKNTGDSFSQHEQSPVNSALRFNDLQFQDQVKLQPQNILQMQRLIGNQATIQLLNGRTNKQSDQKKKTLQRETDEAPAGEESDVIPPEMADFLDDLETGAKSAQKSVDHIRKTIAYYEKYRKHFPEIPTNELVPPGALDEAVNNLKRISNGVSKGLGKFSGAIEKIQGLKKLFTDAEKWAESLSDIAIAAEGIRDLDSLEHFNKVLKKGMKEADPLIESGLAKLASSSKTWAKRASVVGNVLHSYVKVGIAALDSGTKVAKAWHKRRDDYLAQINRPPSQPPPPPQLMDVWVPAAEAREKQKQEEEARKEREKKRKAAEERHKAFTTAREIFENELFPKSFRKQHLQFYRRLKRQYIKAERSGPPQKMGGSEGSSFYQAKNAYHEGMWWDCLTEGGKDERHNFPEHTKVEGGPNHPHYWNEKSYSFTLPGRKARVSLAEAKKEIEKFKKVKVRYEVFDKLYKQEWEKLHQRVENILKYQWSMLKFLPFTDVEMLIKNRLTED